LFIDAAGKASSSAANLFNCAVQSSAITDYDAIADIRERIESLHCIEASSSSSSKPLLSNKISRQSKREKH
jgi:hypothetical protein